MKKRKRQTALQSAPLYAKLIVEEYCCKPSYFCAVRYKTFLRSMSRTHPAYELALKQIEGRA